MGCQIKNAIAGLKVTWDGEQAVLWGMAPLVRHVAETLKAKKHIVLVVGDDAYFNCTYRPYDIMTYDPQSGRKFYWCIVVHDNLLSGHEQADNLVSIPSRRVGNRVYATT